MPEPAQQSKWYRWRKDGTALIAYLLDSEVHTFAFSVAANAILSFIPFIVLLYTLSWSVFHSTDDGERGGRHGELLSASCEHRICWPTIWHAGLRCAPGRAVLFADHDSVACTGIFLPLEVALNQAWGVTKSRNYLHNQVIAFGLAILMVVLGMGSILLNAAARDAADRGLLSPYR